MRVGREGSHIGYWEPLIRLCITRTIASIALEEDAVKLLIYRGCLESTTIRRSQPAEVVTFKVSFASPSKLASWAT
ncbi:hypothetical protein KEJ19_00475 [Candidatus Bathyarchaeota archaeon]|nr:hypothetical protein [Candidatus Bathyarchaeota archaeon]